jgi:translation initiation factor 1
VEYCTFYHTQPASLPCGGGIAIALIEVESSSPVSFVVDNLFVSIKLLNIMATQFDNFNNVDAFDEVNQAEGVGSGNKVHIRVQQRNRRQCILTVQGLDDDLDLKGICKALRKNLNCNGTVVKDKEYGEIIQLQGDHRGPVSEFLVDQQIITKDQLVIHGDNVRA